MPKPTDYFSQKSSAKRRQIASHWLILVAFGWALGSISLAAIGENNSFPVVALSIQILPPSSQSKSIESLTGTITIRNWRPKGGRCFYLPYNDPEYGASRVTSRQLGLSGQAASAAAYSGGRIDVTSKSPKSFEHLSDQIIRINDNAPATITLEFHSIVPKLPQPDPDDEFFDGFYPKPLASCPMASDSPQYFKLPSGLDIEMTVHSPSEWQIHGPSLKLKSRGIYHAQLRARSYNFAATRDYLEESGRAGPIPFKLVYKSAEFKEMIPTVKTSLEEMARWLGPFPFEELIVIETSELQRRGIGGIIGFNRPRQQLFQSLQSKWLNWRHWIMSSYIASQWYGAALGVETPDDEWFNLGISEFVIERAFRKIPDRSNLFVATDDGRRLLSFDYTQAQEITAALLRRGDPLAKLTGPGLETFETQGEQSPLLFIKHTAALSSMASWAGDDVFAAFTRRFTQEHLFDNVEPKKFAHSVSESPEFSQPTDRLVLNDLLQSWWTSSGWPDPAIKDWGRKEMPGGWLVHVEIDQRGSFPVPASVEVVDENDSRQIVRPTRNPTTGEWRLSLLVKEKPKSVVLDPKHAIFDTDRFNNTSSLPGINFFPGSTNTISDEDYTIYWLPIAFRRPAEAISIGLNLGFFRYVDRLFTLRIEYEPPTGRGGFVLKQQHHLPDFLLTANLGLSQNYQSERVGEVSIVRSPLFASPIDVSLGAKARYRAIVGDDESHHATYGFETSLSPRDRSTWYSLKVSGEYENAPLDWSRGFSYERSMAFVRVGLKPINHIDYIAQLFMGHLSSRGAIPDYARFNVENLSEARVRLDISDVPLTNEVVSLGHDLLFPFALPIPGDTLILSRHLRLLLYFDQAWAQGNVGRIFKAAGTGLILPIGGDVAGVGSLALTRLSVTAVLYSQVDDSVSRDPSILFDFTAEI